MCTQLHSNNNDNKNKNKFSTVVYIYAPFTITIKLVMYPYTTSQQQFNVVCHKIPSHNLVNFHMDTMSNNIQYVRELEL